MAGLCSFRQIAVDKGADNTGKGVGGFGFTHREEGKVPRPAGLPQGGGGVKGVQIAGLGKNKRNNVFFRKTVFFQQRVV
jgi:hypothetical protein